MIDDAHVARNLIRMHNQTIGEVDLHQLYRSSWFGELTGDQYAELVMHVSTEIRALDAPAGMNYTGLHQNMIWRDQYRLPLARPIDFIYW
jgi:hypothetical protein